MTDLIDSEDELAATLRGMNGARYPLQIYRMASTIRALWADQEDSNQIRLRLERVVQANKAMLPVVEAVQRWRDDPKGRDDRLVEAVDAYRKERGVANLPVKGSAND